MSTPTPRPMHAVGIIAACGMIDGLTGVLIGIVVLVALRRGATGRQLLAASAITLALAAVANLLPGLPDRLTVSAHFATERMLSHHLAFGGVVLLLIGVLVDEQARRATNDDAT